jgi:oxalate decarboxylase/phosphoglucose isomerase-like protein (cupin superfamily)
VHGYKLFILYPPSSTEALRPIQEEGKESMQSELDPLEDAAVVSGCQVALLKPGEAILVPQGWWHYAVALTPSTTAQANFYEAGTNAAALVSFVLSRVAPLLKAKCG